MIHLVELAPTVPNEVAVQGFMYGGHTSICMTQSADAPGDYIDGDRSQSDKVNEIMRLEHEMEEMLALETGKDNSDSSTAHTVATNTTK